MASVPGFSFRHKSHPTGYLHGLGGRGSIPADFRARLLYAGRVERSPGSATRPFYQWWQAVATYPMLTLFKMDTEAEFSGRLVVLTHQSLQGLRLELHSGITASVPQVGTSQVA